jgi:hypothetical protein
MPSDADAKPADESNGVESQAYKTQPPDPSDNFITTGLLAVWEGSFRVQISSINEREGCWLPFAWASIGISSGGNGRQPNHADARLVMRLK